MSVPLMLFAAGFGTRMADLTADQPKPLIPVAGRALIDHALALADGADAGPVVINLHYRGDQIRDHLRARAEVRFSHETPDILETGGGLRQALPLLGAGPVLVLNSDAVWTGANPLVALAKAWDARRMDALLMLTARARAIGHRGDGDFTMDAQGRLARGHDLVYTGAQILRTEVLADIPERSFSLNRVWDLMEARGRLFGMEHHGNWCDVGYPGAIPLAEAMLADADV